MALKNSSYLKDGQRQPLTHGKIQLQSEAAEVFYKEIKIKPLTTMPIQYVKYFAEKSTGPLKKACHILASSA